MAGKKAKRPGPRYLLSADRRLQKLSLKKLAQPRAKASSSKRGARTSTAPARAAESPRWPWTATPGALGLAGLGILAAATLFAAGQTSDRSEAANVTTVSEPRFVNVASSPTPAKRPTPPEERTTVREKTATSKPAIATTTVASASAPVAVSTPDAAPVGSVTITGCLAKGKSGFWLKDVSGADLSKKRSWRSGFFKKSTPRVDVVAASSAVQLAAYVGQRVAATGLLEDQELRARSVRSLASACN